VLIRPANEADLAQIAAVYAREVREGTATYEVVAPDVAEMTCRWQALTHAGFPYLAAEVESAIAGFAYASPYRSRPGYRWTVEDTVYVAPEYRGRGLGRVLLKQLISDCEAMDVRQMIAVIGDADNSKSIDMHRGLGFAEAGRFEGLGRKHGRWLTSVQMLRPLCAGVGEPPLFEPDTL
jgi:phosphinothricin acetyltransferase